MQKIITATAHGMAYLLFLIPTDEKYTVMTYSIVSELPIITEAQSAVKLSGPYSPSRAE